MAKKVVFFSMALMAGVSWVQPVNVGNEKAWMASLSDPKEIMLSISAKRSGKKADAFDFNKVHAYIKNQMSDTSQEATIQLAQCIQRLSKQYRFHPELILSLIRVESQFHTWAVSPNGAIGLMQLMPETGRWLADRLGVTWDGPSTLLDPETNLRFGVYYLAYLRDKYNGDPKTFLAAYNMGPKRIDDWAVSGYQHSMEYYKLVKQNLPELGR